MNKTESMKVNISETSCKSENCYSINIPCFENCTAPEISFKHITISTTAN